MSAENIHPCIFCDELFEPGVDAGFCVGCGILTCDDCVADCEVCNSAFCPGCWQYHEAEAHPHNEPDPPAPEEEAARAVAEVNRPGQGHFNFYGGKRHMTDRRETAIEHFVFHVRRILVEQDEEARDVEGYPRTAESFGCHAMFDARKLVRIYEDCAPFVTWSACEVYLRVAVRLAAWTVRLLQAIMERADREPGNDGARIYARGSKGPRP